MRIGLLISALLVSWSIQLKGQLQQKISDIINHSNSENAHFGISVKSQSGKSLYDYQSKTRLIPASTFKLITTLSLINQKGSDYRYETQVGYVGTISQDGTLEGDLIVRGSGDPSFGSPKPEGDVSYADFLSQIVDWVQSKGITCIDGAVVLDNSIFDEQAVHPSWAWDDLTNYYASGAWGFNIHENFYFLDFERSATANVEASIGDIRPEVPGLRFSNKVKTGKAGSGDNAYIYGNPYDHIRWAEGTIPPGSGKFTIKGALPDPSLFAAYHVSQALTTSSIKVNEYRTTNERIEKINPLGTFRSAALSDMVKYANYTSNNLYCDAFFKTIGSSLTAQGSFDRSREKLEAQLSSFGLDLTGIRIEDGSGLSARNRISPDFMTSFLREQGKQQGIDVLKTYIPKAGKQGSVKRFLNNYSAQDHSWLKSGSINNVLAYAGILKTAGNQDVYLSIMANGHNSNRRLRAQMEQIIELLYKEL